MHKLLLDSDTRMRLARFLADRPRPAKIGFKTWHKLIDGSLAALDLADMAIMCDDFGAETLFDLLDWPRHERRRFSEDDENCYVQVAKPAI